MFPTLLADEVGRIIKVKNSNKRQKKPRINMITKKPSRKQVIIPIAKLNAELIINSANQIITNINKSLWEIKSDISANFICIINDEVIITMNKPVNTYNLKTIKKCIKNSNNVNSNAIDSLCLSKFKLYLKIIRISYIGENSLIISNTIKGILKEMHVFNDIILVSKPHVIKVSPKFDIAVI